MSATSADATTTDPAGAGRALELVERHRQLLADAVAALTDRGYWSAYSERPKSYPEDAPVAAQAAFDALRGTAFPIDTPGASDPDDRVGAEHSPYGFDLGITYPHVADLDALMTAAQAGMPAWRDAGPEIRAAVCAEIISRLNARSFEIALAAMHTTGQAWAMAFQAAGPHAQDRALEAVAYGLAEMTRLPAEARWEKPQGSRDPLVMTKRYTAVPRGVALVVGCNTFPTWNGYPGMFASLVTGNAVVVKPHPHAVLPLAITAAVCRDVLTEAGFDPNLVCLAAEAPGEGLAKPLALRPEVKIIDYTGGSAFGTWLEENARQAQVYTEKSGVNTVVVDSTDAYKGMLGNLAFSLSLYSGQMCTTPQNILVPAGGIDTDEGHRSAEEFAVDLAGAIDRLLGDPAKAVEITGAIVNDDVLGRADGAAGLGSVVRPAAALEHPAFPGARVRTPAIVQVDAAGAGQDPAYLTECFGPVTFVITTPSTEASVALLRDTITAKGSLTASVYSTDESVLAAAEDAALAGGVLLSENLTGGVFVNQTAAFSDLHGSGNNPAANSAYTDDAFVASRFRWAQSRRHA